jgi:hypothetical protein
MRADLPVGQNHQPPAFGAPQRDAIGSIVDGIADDFCHKINAVRQSLDHIKQEYLQSAANAKAILNGHVEVCVRLDDEIRHMQAAVADIRIGG